MSTLKNQIENVASIFPDYFSNELNQECIIIDRNMAANGCGAEFLLIELSGKITVAVIEGQELTEIDSDYVKHIFNK